MGYCGNMSKKLFCVCGHLCLCAIKCLMSGKAILNWGAQHENIDIFNNGYSVTQNTKVWVTTRSHCLAVLLTEWLRLRCTEEQDNYPRKPFQKDVNTFLKWIFLHLYFSSYSYTQKFAAQKGLSKKKNLNLLIPPFEYGFLWTKLLTSSKSGRDARSNRRAKQHIQSQDILRVMGYIFQLVLRGAAVQSQLSGTIPTNKLWKRYQR